MRNYNPKRPPIPACGLIEDDPEEFEEEDLLSDSPTFPLEVFPEAIRNIVEAFEEYENFNVDFTATSFLTSPSSQEERSASATICYGR